MEEGEEEVKMGYGSGFDVLHLVGRRVCGYPFRTEVSTGGIRGVVSQSLPPALNPCLNHLIGVMDTTLLRHSRV